MKRVAAPRPALDLAVFGPAAAPAGGAASAHGLVRLAPGALLCVLVAGGAVLLKDLEARVFGGIWIEPLVLAILLGALVRSVFTLDRRLLPGVEFSSKILLEAAVVLLGASVSASTLLAAGPLLLLAIFAVVAFSLCASFGMGRLLRLPPRMAILVACGNSICGNSAIAAVAPVIGADGEDVAASIAFTAVLGVGVVLILPAAAVCLRLTGFQFGALAGLTVYAVPQVLAATQAAGPTAVQVGTLVKLVRVLALGPVCCVLALLTRMRPEAIGVSGHGAGAAGATAPSGPKPAPLKVGKLVPWFILGFLAMIAVRSTGALPPGLLPPIAAAAGVLTVISMAGLGLSTDVRVVARAGGRVSLAVLASLLLLAVLSYGVVLLLRLP